ncbi:ABC transporter ATP-binding protein [Fusibacter ferrireducens]|uniref:Dipeptide ABC transporter ATP-binding protein n=1 Tax=Fusibacter ferrireducens TaxID=2785058 RepID=A0ABR9ZS30_9FIRM|nr:dipeptide ABC transporter ATP-binding protein [Fusibacter ferrireducens]MBF4693266.1 dipeptide ABC transporter ATP-binding protein [Fusibacter ferrireducens]
MSEILLSAKNLKKYYQVSNNTLFSSNANKGIVKAVDDITLDIPKGKTLSLVGESGCGKSTLGRTLINLIDPTSGEVLFNGKNIHAFNAQEEKAFRKSVSIIFQDPYASLNPRMKVKDLIGEPLLTHGMKAKKERYARVYELMKITGLKEEYANRYPHQFSGGQRQRIGIARALALNPSLIVCDEAVSALDVSIQAQILNLLKKLQREFNLTYLFISHDLSVVRYVSDEVYVMYLGQIVEAGKPKALFEEPIHPYTQFLISAVPIADPKKRDRKKLILEGDLPSAINPPQGCRFNTRCPYATEICTNVCPELVTEDDRKFACHHPLG